MLDGNIANLRAQCARRYTATVPIGNVAAILETPKKSGFPLGSRFSIGAGCRTRTRHLMITNQKKSKFPCVDRHL